MRTHAAKPSEPVLVVEDTDDSREVMGALLEMEGYRVAYAGCILT
jgi:CheY-like chemotaxis protein